MIVLATLILAGCFFMFDMHTPLGIGEWGMYLVPLLISFHARPRRYPLVMAGISTVLLGIGYWGSAAGVDARWALLNRCMGVAVLWLTAVLLIKRKAVVLELKENERRLRAILDHAPVAIFMKDLSGRYVEFNRECEQFTGKSREQMLGRTDEEVFPEDVAKMYVTTDQAAIKAGTAIQEVMRIPGRNGTRTALAIKFPMLDAEGKRKGVGGVSADVTELKQAEHALRENQERLNLAQMAADVGIFEYVLAGKKAHWSPAIERLYGLAPGSFGGGYENWAQMLEPEDRKRVEAELAEALARKQEFRTEYRIIRPDGAVRWIRSMSKVFCDEAGEAERLVGINVDITDQRQALEAIAFSNQRLGLISQVTAAAVGSRPLQEEGRKLAEQVMAAFGFDACVIRTLRGEKLELLASAGMPESKLQPAIPADGEVFQTVRASRNPIFVPNAGEHPGTRSFVSQLQPGERFVSYVGAPLLVQDQVVGIIGIYSRKEVQVFSETDQGHLQVVANHIAVAIANDRLFKEVQRQSDKLAEEVAERETAEEALRQTTEQLQTLSRRLLEMQEAERRHIARELHDEIGQALTALKINLQAVQRTFDADHVQPRLLDSIDIVDRTLRQVRNLSLDLRPSMLDDLGLSAALRWYADQQAQRAGLRIQFVAHEMAEKRLASELETSCFRVAQEALTNVVRHAQATTVVVELSQGDGYLHLTVRDDGVGFNVEKARVRLREGASLGLLGMEERASLAGGRIELKSATEQGTEVHGWFPLAVTMPERRQTINATDE